MANKNLALKAFKWAVVLTSLFVLTLGAVLISLVVGDWILWKTANSVLSWFVGSVVLIGFLATLGTGIGIWIWVKGPASHKSDDDKRTDTMDMILKDMNVIERD